jgi:hypothetical protein
MTTRKYIKKEQKKKLLLDSGYNVFNTHGYKADELYAIIVIACNRINPDNPSRAFKTVAELMRKLSHAYSNPNMSRDDIPARGLVRTDSETLEGDPRGGFSHVRGES